MSSEHQGGAYFGFSHILHYVGNSVLLFLIVSVSLYVMYRFYIWRRSRRQNQSSNPQLSLRRAHDPFIQAGAASRLLGVNNPFQRRPLPPLYREGNPDPASAPLERGVWYNATTREIELPLEPYSDQHQRVSSELEQQTLQKNLQAQLNRLSQLPVMPDAE